MNRYFTQEDTAMAKKDLKRCSASLYIKEVLIQYQHIYQYTSIWMAKVKKNCENVEKLGHTYISSRNVKWYSHYGKQSGSFLKKKKTN